MFECSIDYLRSTPKSNKMAFLLVFLLFIAAVSSDLRISFKTHVTSSNPHTYLRQAGPSVSEFNPLDFFMSYDETNQWLKALTLQYPHKCKLETVGQSYEGRDINAITINYDKPTKVILLANLHAREWAAMTAAIYIIHELILDSDSYPEAGQLQWIIIPMPNPDGYEYTRLEDRIWRKNRTPQANNAVGVDLNRNFGFQWEMLMNAVDDNPREETYRGTGPFSEPESRVIGKVLRDHADATLFLDMHTYGQYILIPWGYTDEPAPNAEKARAVAKAGSEAIFNNVYKVGTPGELLYKVSGSSLDYCNSIGIKVCIAIELTQGGFEISPQEIIPYGTEAFAAVQAMALEAN
uniref:Peptidase M14 domain-containing protein n=1 Tax=Anopheles farauti TaxID=69004 RepID=A0A182QA66_9DIPT